MTDEKPKTSKTPKPQAPKPAEKRASKGYRKYLRRMKEVARKLAGGN